MMEEADSRSEAIYGVLVIDDEPGLRRLCRRLLEKGDSGHRATLLHTFWAQ